ncbi:MAG TPA: hypothetical protein VKI44_09155 [Acetobacteraceae bacterium]|nr:hypothetical protein [Acetobacteraceae bacterium]
MIGGVAAAALLLAGAAAAQTRGNGPATPTPGNGMATTSTPTVTTARPDDATSATTSGTVGNSTASTTVLRNGSMVNGGEGDSNGAVNTSSQNQPQPARGANSFTQGEAKDRLQAHGYSNVSDLRKDANGVWRGQAEKGGQQVSVWLDYKGNVGEGTAGQSAAQ